MLYVGGWMDTSTNTLWELVYIQILNDTYDMYVYTYINYIIYIVVCTRAYVSLYLYLYTHTRIPYVHVTAHPHRIYIIVFVFFQGKTQKQEECEQ